MTYYVYDHEFLCVLYGLLRLYLRYDNQDFLAVLQRKGDQFKFKYLVIGASSQMIELRYNLDIKLVVGICLPLLKSVKDDLL